MSIDKPEWCFNDIQLYRKLYYQTDYSELTEEQKEFCKTMNIMEEYACGLDGDK